MALFRQVLLMTFCVILAECVYRYDRHQITLYGSSPSPIPYAGLVTKLDIPNEEVRDHFSPVDVTTVTPKLESRSDEVDNQAVFYQDRNKHFTEGKQKRKLINQVQNKSMTAEETITNNIRTLTDSEQQKPSLKVAADDNKNSLANRTGTNETSVNRLRDYNYTTHNVRDKNAHELSNRFGSDNFIMVPVSASDGSFNFQTNNQPNGNINVLVPLSSSDIPFFNNVNQAPVTGNTNNLLTSMRNPNTVEQVTSGNSFIPVVASIQNAGNPYNDIKNTLYSIIPETDSNQLLSNTRGNIQSIPVTNQNLNDPNVIGHNVNINPQVPSNNIRIIAPFSSDNTEGLINPYNSQQNNHNTANLISLNNNIPNVEAANSIGGQSNLYALVNIPNNNNMQGTNLPNSNLYVLNNVPTNTIGYQVQHTVPVPVYRIVTTNSAPNGLVTLGNVIGNYGSHTPNNGVIQPNYAVSNNQMLLAVNG